MNGQTPLYDKVFFKYTDKNLSHIKINNKKHANQVTYFNLSIDVLVFVNYCGFLAVIY
jgi:hypothetical protein